MRCFKFLIERTANGTAVIILLLAKNASKLARVRDSQRMWIAMGVRR